MTKPQNVPTAQVVLAPIFEAKHAQLEARDRKRKTLANYKRAVVPFQHWLDQRGTDPLEVEPEDIEAYEAHCIREFRESEGKRGYAPGSRRVHFNYIKSAYRLAVDRGKLDSMPFGSVEIPKVPEYVPEVISTEELHRMGLAAKIKSWRHLALWALLTYTGMRRNEIRLLRWDDIDLDGGELTVRHGKGGKVRVVPIHRTLKTVLMLPQYTGKYGVSPRIEKGTIHGSRRTGYVLSPNGSEGTHPYADGEGFTKLLKVFYPGDSNEFHAFRKTVASSLFANGVQQADIEAILGWATKSVFAKHYLVRRPGHLAECIGRLYLLEGDPAEGVVYPAAGEPDSNGDGPGW
jgi:integrase/recombinase XerD